MEKSKVIEKLFFDIVTFSYLLLPLAFLVSKNKKTEKIPLVIAIYGVIFFFLLFYYSSVPKEYRKLFQTLYTYLEYLFFTFFFWSNIKSGRFRSIAIILSVSFLAFQIIYFLNTQLIRLDSIPIGIETILILIYIFYFFYEFAKNAGTHYIYNHYCFWISVGILIYLGGSFFFYILINHLNQVQVNQFGNLTFLAELVKNLLFVSAIFIYIRYPFKQKKEEKKAIPYLDMI